MMTSGDYRSNATPSPGCLPRLINLVSNLYLISMVAYFAVRLLVGDDLWWIALLNDFAIYTFFPLLLLMPAALLAGRWRTLIRLSFLAVLAIVWFGPFFQPKNVRPTAGDVIKVVTFNVWGSNTETEKVAQWLSDVDADVVLLQEITEDYAAGGIQALTATYPHQNAQWAWGNMMLIKHPLVDYREVNAAVQRAVIQVNDTQIAVYNVHFSMPLVEPARINLPILGTISQYNPARRDKQIDELLEILEKETLPYIVAGDFNLSQHSIKYGEITVRLRDSYRDTSSGLGATWSTQMLFPLLRLDYIWHSAGLRAVDTEVGPELGSDHLPVIAVIEVL